MKRALGTALVAAILLGPLASLAAGAEIWELLSFKRQGISDDVLIALIETDGSEFHLTAGDVQMLHDKGLSDRVILAMLKTAKKRVDAPAPPLAPQTDVPLLPVDPNAPPPDQQPPAGASTYVGAPLPADDQTMAPPPEPPAPLVQEIYVPIAVPVVVGAVVSRPDHHPIAPQPVAVKPEYWGWGGERRPGTWDPPSPVVVVAKPAGPSSSVGSNGLGAPGNPKKIGGS